jgi:glycosyltransferase involved in cell wall biosynthesis
LRVIFLSEVFYPEQTSTGFLLSEIADGLADEFEVVAITCSATNFFEKVQSEIKHPRIKIHRVKDFGTNRGNLVKRLFYSLIRSISLLIAALWVVKREDKVFVVTNPPTLPWITLLASFLKGFKYVVICHDVYPNVLFSLGIVKPTSLFGRILKFLTRASLMRAKLTITLGRDMSKLIKDDFGVNNIKLIPNWAELDIITGKDFWQKSEEPTIFLYAGNLGLTHELDVILDIASIPNTRVIVAGFGSQELYLKSQIKKRNLSNIEFVGKYPRSKQNSILTLGDIAIISFKKGMHGVSVPSRMYNHMAAGTPILAISEPNSELSLVVQEEDCGWVIDPEDPKLIDLVAEIASNKDEIIRKGQNGRKACLSKYTKKHAIEKYREILCAV